MHINRVKISKVPGFEKKKRENLGEGLVAVQSGAFAAKQKFLSML
jgi:hypothetical protein